MRLRVVVRAAPFSSDLRVEREPPDSAPRLPDAANVLRIARMSQKDPAPAILIVDDNADAADSLALILDLEGFRTRAVYDGR
ncbi:MAG TPA: hypothetical protein PK177_23530, partial [Burkholderiaceae bacterium]|nr:hypothetical protein [Burkholderiaceae bacterium]